MNGYPCKSSSQSPTEIYRAKVEAGEIGEGDRITRFFRHQVTDVITRPVYNRIVIGVVFGVWVWVGYAPPLPPSSLAILSFSSSSLLADNAILFSLQREVFSHDLQWYASLCRNQSTDRQYEV